MQSVRNPLLVSPPNYPSIVRYTTGNCTLAKHALHLSGSLRCRQDPRGLGAPHLSRHLDAVGGAPDFARPSTATEVAFHYAFPTQLLAGHLLNERVEIRAGQVGADAC